MVENYQGILSRYIDDIKRRRKNGETFDSIGYDYRVTGAAVAYALKRNGLLRPRDYTHPFYAKHGKRRQLLIDEKDEYIIVPIRGAGKGRPIDMGGPRDVWIEDDPIFPLDTCGPHRER